MYTISAGERAIPKKDGIIKPLCILKSAQDSAGDESARANADDPQRIGDPECVVLLEPTTFL
jgi:hypothetical protein